MLSFRPVLQEDAPELAAMADEIWNEYFTALFTRGGYHVSHSLKSDIGDGYTMDLYILEKEL